MDREKLIKCIKLLTEINRRKNTKLAMYNSGKIKHLKQIIFHKSTAKNKWAFGGNRSGKSECGAVEVIYLARGVHPYRKNITRGTDGWVVSLSSKVQREVSQAKILSYLDPSWIVDIVMSSGSKDLPKYGVIDKIILKNFFGNLSTITFKTCEEGREMFQGASLDYVWFDEEPPKSIYDECKMRVLDRSGYIFGTMTPLKGLTYIYDEIYLNKGNDPEVFYVTMEWGDNPYIPKKEIERLTASMSSEELEARRFGRFLDFGNGCVYPEFDESVNVIEPFDVPASWQETISIDPGLKNPLSCHWYAVDYDGNVYVVAEHYEAEKNIDYHAERIKEISNSLGWHRGRTGKIEAIIDSAASQTTLASSRSVVDLFYDNDILVSPKVNKDLFAGISRVKSYLKNAKGESKLFIFKNCVNLIREIKTYRWGDKDLPIKKDDHALDELRYFIMTRPDANIEKEELTPVQRDKEKMIRALNRKRRFDF